MVGNIPGSQISRQEDERGFGQASQNVLINGRRVSGKSNDAGTALGRISADTVLRIEIVDGASLDIPGLSGQVANVIAKVDALSGNWSRVPEFRENLQPSWFRGEASANGKAAASRGRSYWTSPNSTTDMTGRVSSPMLRASYRTFAAKASTAPAKGRS